MRLDENSLRLGFAAGQRSMRAEIDAVRATIASEWQALRRELAEARAELNRLKVLLSAERAEKQEIARQRIIVEASCAVRDPEMPLQ